MRITLLRIDYIRVLREKLHTHEGINFLWENTDWFFDYTERMYVCMSGLVISFQTNLKGGFFYRVVAQPVLTIIASERRMMNYTSGMIEC